MAALVAETLRVEPCAPSGRPGARNLETHVRTVPETSSIGATGNEELSFTLHLRVPTHGTPSPCV